MVENGVGAVLTLTVGADAVGNASVFCSDGMKSEVKVMGNVG